MVLPTPVSLPVATIQTIVNFLDIRYINKEYYWQRITNHLAKLSHKENLYMKHYVRLEQLGTCNALLLSSSLDTRWPAFPLTHKCRQVAYLTIARSYHTAKHANGRTTNSARN